MDDGPRGVRAIERRYRGTGDSNDGFALACAQGRAGDADGAFRTLSDLISDDGRGDGVHQQAIVAFRGLLG